MKSSTKTDHGAEVVQQIEAAGNMRSWDPVIRCDAFSSGIRESGLDLAEIEWQARAAQSAWIASTLKSYFAALMRKLRTRSKVTTASTTGLKNLQNDAA